MRKMNVIFVDDNPPETVPDDLYIIESIATWEEHISWWARPMAAVPDLLIIDVNFCDDNTAPSNRESLRDCRGLVHGAVVASRVLGQSRARPLGIGIYSRQGAHYVDDGEAKFAMGILRAQIGFPVDECLSDDVLRESIADIRSKVEHVIRSAKFNFIQSLLAAIRRGDAFLEGDVGNLPVRASDIIEWTGRFGVESISAESLFDGICSESRRAILEEMFASQIPIGKYAGRLVKGLEIDGEAAPVRHRWKLLWTWWTERRKGDLVSAQAIMNLAEIAPSQAARAMKSVSGPSWAKLVSVLDRSIGLQPPECLCTIDWLLIRKACLIAGVEPPFREM